MSSIYKTIIQSYKETFNRSTFVVKASAAQSITKLVRTGLEGTDSVATGTKTSASDLVSLD
jgi:hypothetical protein